MNILTELENIMSAFLDGIEAKIAKLTGNHGVDNSHLNADIKAFITETVTGAVADVKGIVDQQTSDITDLKQAINDAVDHLSDDDNDSATQVLKTAVEEIGVPAEGAAVGNAQASTETASSEGTPEAESGATTEAAPSADASEKTAEAATA